PPYYSAHLSVKPGKVGVIRMKIATMIDNDKSSITTIPAGKSYDPVGRGPDGSAGRGPDVHTLMEFPFTCKRIGALSKRGHQGALHRPQVGLGGDLWPPAACKCQRIYVLQEVIFFDAVRKTGNQLTVRSGGRRTFQSLLDAVGNGYLACVKLQARQLLVGLAHRLLQVLVA